MDRNFLYRIVMISLFLANASCATAVLVGGAKQTDEHRYRTGNKREDVHIHLKENKIVVQFEGQRYERATNKTTKTKLDLETVYDIDDAIKLESEDLNTFIIKPKKYAVGHNGYTQENGWTLLPLNLMLSDQFNKKSLFADRGADSDLKSYRDFIKRSQHEIQAYRALFDHAENSDTSIWASISPAHPDPNVLKTTFDRRAVFIDRRDGKKTTYILMMPSHKVTTGHGKKVLLVLLPATITFDLVTFPIQLSIANHFARQVGK